MLPTFNPRKNSLSISLTESVVFLRSIDRSANRSPSPDDNASPSIVRGLLILTLVRPTRICNIQVEFTGQSITTWTEGQSTRYPAELLEKINLFSATRTFFEAPRIPSSRRALSLEHGLSHYADDAEFINRHRPSSPSIARASGHIHQTNPVDIPRGRERARARLGADEYILERELPPQSHSPPTPGLSSPSPASSADDSSVPPLNSSVNHLPRRPPLVSSRSAIEQRSPTISPPSMINLSYESRSLPRHSPSVSHLSLLANSNLHSSQPSSLSREGRRAYFDDQSAERQRSPSRGRVRSGFSFASVSSSIREAMRSVQSMPNKRGHSRQGEESRDDVRSHTPPTRLSDVGEVVDDDGNEHCSESSGDGWQEFKKGTYTFPISFAIPSHVPPTMQCNYGSVCWRLKATVHRPGALTPKLSASHDVILVASPSEDDRDDTDNVTINRFWEDQMEYALSISGRVFPIGGTVPITLRLLPLAKVKIFKVLVQLEEQVDYFFTFSDKARRKDPDRQVELLALQSEDEDTPLLPLPQVVTPATESTLRSLLRSHDDPSESMASLMGLGPWTLQMDLTVPDISGTLHFSNKNKRAQIEITHTLKVVVRVQRGDEQEADPHTGKPKQYDIVMRAPVHMLSPLSNAHHTALPRYSDIFGASSPLAPPCAPSEGHGDRFRRAHRSVILQSQVATGGFRPLALPEEQSAEVDAFYERNVIFERLITGQQREDGSLPPAYCATS